METIPIKPIGNPESGQPAANRRILIVDDNNAIHEDFQKTLRMDTGSKHYSAEITVAFGVPTPVRATEFALSFAHQGEEAVNLVRDGLKNGLHYAMAFIDVRMPPGMDGVETSIKLWELDPDLQIVLCTAYSDYSWADMMDKITHPDRLLILKKPFDSIEVQQLAQALSDKWSLVQEAKRTTHELERMVSARTFELKAANALLQREISDRIQREAKILEQATLLDQARDAIMVSDLDGNVMFWNEGALRLYGWTCEEALGKRVVDLIFDKHICFDEAYQATLSNGCWTGEQEHKSKAGAFIAVESRWTLVTDESGQPKSILAINSDVTEKKQLAARVIQAQRVESIGTLAGGIAHNLNNVLAPIVMAVDYLRLKFTDKESDDALATLESNAARASDLVKQVLSFARGYEGQHVMMEPKRVVHDISKIIKEIFPRNIELKISLDPDLWNVLGDFTQIHQVLLNLCINARDAMPHGGMLKIVARNQMITELPASVGSENARKPHVIIEVIDNGTGIPESILGKIFDPFFTTKEIGKGTGLGLSTSLGIIKSHSGRIYTHSEEGVGSRFEIHLPACIEEKTETEMSSNPPQGNGELILVIDDELPVRRITQMTLESFGYQAIVAADGAQGVKLYSERQNEIVLVITDMMMPGMDGVATINAIIQINPHVKIIAASGIDSTLDAVGKAGLSVDGFISKPCTAEELLRIIAGSLANLKNQGNEVPDQHKPKARIHTLPERKCMTPAQY